MFYFALESGGRLFLGSSESVDEAAGGVFKTLDKKQRLYARGVAPRPVVPVLPSGSSSLALAGENGQVALNDCEGVSIHSAAACGLS